MWLWIKHEIFKTEPPSKRNTAKSDLRHSAAESHTESWREGARENGLQSPGESARDSKEVVSVKKKPQPVMRFKKVIKNLPPVEIVQEVVEKKKEEEPITHKISSFEPQESEVMEELKLEIEPSLNKFQEVRSKVSYIESAILELKQDLTSFVSSSSSPGLRKSSFSQKKYENGNVYMGEFSGSLREGRGRYIWASGDTYEGEWVKDKQHGMGKSTWAGGNSYVGYFENNDKSGIGEYIWGDGSSYVGGWRENKMNGVGRYRWTDGKEYIGEWETGNREGLGIMIYKNGNRYEGEIHKGKPQGQGTLYEKLGKTLRGQWQNGKIVLENN